MVLSVGSQVTGNYGTYRVIKKLADGGMGFIWLATSDTGEDVIVKETKVAGDGCDDIRLQKLRFEAQLLRSINHPNIVKHVDEKDAGSTFYLVEEYVPGDTMKRFAGNPAPEKMAKHFSIVLLEALRYLHNPPLDILHRDIKPPNIIVEPKRDLVLIDLGGCKKAYMMSDSGLVTPGWGAPEQFTTGVLTPACDIYATGALLFFLLTGEEPRFHMKSTGALVKLPCDVNPSVSREISDIVATAMQPDVASRYQTAGDMISMLTNGRSVAVGVPHVIVGSMKYKIKGSLTIGRTHTCTPECTKRGFCLPPDVSIDDPPPGVCISRHHAKVFVDSQGDFWVEDLHSLNSTAVGRRGSWLQLPTGRSERLQDSDVIALAYKDKKGPYRTITFKTS